MEIDPGAQEGPGRPLRSGEDGKMYFNRSVDRGNYHGSVLVNGQRLCIIT